VEMVGSITKCSKHSKEKQCPSRPNYQLVPSSIALFAPVAPYSQIGEVVAREGRQA